MKDAQKNKKPQKPKAVDPFIDSGGPGDWRIPRNRLVKPPRSGYVSDYKMPDYPANRKRS